jgi:GT2 family glycosyltransferase
MTPDRIGAVVVTFNRKQLLTECIDALLKQSRQLDAIFIVDNASSDGTQSYLQDRGYFDFPLITFIRLNQNMGGAGGFHSGMDAAIKAGLSWVWLMDDDSEPYFDSLETMQVYRQYARVVAIANLKVDRSGKETADGLRFLPKTGLIKTEYEQIRFSSFVGLLISSAAILRIGLPKSEFFIHNDDTEYCMRLRSIGDIALARDSLVAHKEVARAQKSARLFSHVFYQKDIEGFCFEYFGHRNYAWIQENYCANWFVRYVILLSRFVCFAAAVMVFDYDHRWLRLKILFKANLDGILSRFDNGFPFRLREQLRRQKPPLKT